MSRPSSWPVTNAGSHSWQCFTSLRMTCPSSCTVLKRVSLACAQRAASGRRAHALPSRQLSIYGPQLRAGGWGRLPTSCAAPYSVLRQQNSRARQEPLWLADAGLPDRIGATRKLNAPQRTTIARRRNSVAGQLRRMNAAPRAAQRTACLPSWLLAQEPARHESRRRADPPEASVVVDRYNTRLAADKSGFAPAQVAALPCLPAFGMHTKNAGARLC